MDVAIGPYLADALPANRNGQLTDIQRRNLGNYEGSKKSSTRRFTLVPLALAAIFLFAPGLKASATVHYGVPFICIIVAITLIARSSSSSDPLARDLREGKVSSYQGLVDKGGSVAVNRDLQPRLYLLDVSGKRFQVAHSTYDALPDGIQIRVYYLPHSNHVVNIERPSDDMVVESQTVPNNAGTLVADSFVQNDSGTSGPDPFAQDVLGTLGSDPFASDALTSLMGNDARDTIQAMGDPIEERFNQHSAPPAGMVPNPPSLSSALVGTWRSRMMTVTFHADGTVDGMARNGMQRTGHWSVDADGRLQSDVMGMNQAVDARIRDGQLEISLGGIALVFDRVSS